MKKRNILELCCAVVVIGTAAWLYGMLQVGVAPVRVHVKGVINLSPYFVTIYSSDDAPNSISYEYPEAKGTIFEHKVKSKMSLRNRMPYILVPSNCDFGRSQITTEDFPVPNAPGGITVEVHGGGTIKATKKFSFFEGASLAAGGQLAGPIKIVVQPDLQIVTAPA